MLSWTYGTGPSDVVTDLHGNAVTNRRLLVYDQPRGGGRVSDLKSLDGDTLPGVLYTDDDGRYPFARDAETRPVLWLDDGQTERRWAVVATEAVEAAGDMAHYAHRVSEAAGDAATAAHEAADSAAEAATSRDMAQTALDEVTLVQQQTPTREELFFSAYIPARVAKESGNLRPEMDGEDGGAIISIMSAPYDLRVTSVALCWDYWEFSADNTTYWEINPTRIDGSTAEWEPFATRTTQPSGDNANGGIKARRPWTFSGADLSSTIGQGDLFGLWMQSFGGADRMDFGFSVTVGYTPERSESGGDDAEE